MKGINMTDNVTPKDKWVFDEDVAECFEDMLERSIPQYDVMRDTAFNLGIKVMNKNKVSSMLDIGCSDGLNIDRYVKKLGAYGRYRGIDISEPMLEKARKRFVGFIECNIVHIENMDLRKDFPRDAYNLITSILTIQFTPIEYRQMILQKIYDHLEFGGGFIMVEKVLGNCSEINEIMVEEYLKLKESNGYTKDQIERKRLSLEGVLVPMTSNWNIDMLKQAGFKKIDVFWRWMNFEGYIAIK